MTAERPPSGGVGPSRPAAAGGARGPYGRRRAQCAALVAAANHGGRA